MKTQCSNYPITEHLLAFLAVFISKCILPIIALALSSHFAILDVNLNVTSARRKVRDLQGKLQGNKIDKEMARIF